MELAHLVKLSHKEVIITLYYHDHAESFIFMILHFMYSIASTGTPQLVTVTPVNSTTVNVSWSEVQCFNGSGAVPHYLVQYQSVCDGAVQSVATSDLVQTVSGLTPNVAVYTFQVAAVGASQKIGPFSTLSRTCPHSKLYKINALPNWVCRK